MKGVRYYFQGNIRKISLVRVLSAEFAHSLIDHDKTILLFLSVFRACSVIFVN